MISVDRMEEAAADEDYWPINQNAFSVTRGMIDLNNGGVSPSLRIATRRSCPPAVANL